MARKSQSQPQELPYEMGSVAPSDIIEFDPNAPVAAAASAVEPAQLSAGILLPEEGLFKARDAVESMLGGSEAIVSALSEGVSSTAGLGVENIMGIGVGVKSSAGTYTGEMAVKVFVREKAPTSRLEASAAVPATIDGYPTDVEEVGELIAQSYNRRYPRPVPCGTSCGHVSITAGTIGCLVVLDNNRLCILSNNHVLANENDAQIGDAIVQPGPVDGGRMPADRIGALERFVPIQFRSSNRVDAAVAWTSFSLVNAEHVTYRLNPIPLAPTLSLSVMKNGRTTQATQGVITGIGVNRVQVRYGRGVALFDNQVFIRGIGAAPFSQGGDSGSLIVATGTRQPVALLFAGSATHTIGNPIDAVMSALGIRRFIGP